MSILENCDSLKTHLLNQFSCSRDSRAELSYPKIEELSINPHSICSSSHAVKTWMLIVNAPLKQLAASGHSGVLCSRWTGGDNAGKQPAISHNMAGGETLPRFGYKECLNVTRYLSRNKFSP